MDGTRISKRLVNDLVSLTMRKDMNFKLLILNGICADSEIPSVELKEENFALETIIGDSLNCLILNHPELHVARSTLREGLLAQSDHAPGVFAGSYDTVTTAVRSWLELAIRLAEPICISSITRSLTSMPHKIEDIYKIILKQIPPQNRRNVKKALSWLVLSQRPLEVAELAVAVALRDEVQMIKQIRENEPTNLPGELRRTLGSIVTDVDGRYLLLPE